MPQIFSSADLAEFYERGFLVLRSAFDPSVAAQSREVLWQRLEADYPVRRADRSTWTKVVHHIHDTFGQRPGEEAFRSVWTPRLVQALDEIMGEGRWNRFGGFGWWPVAFPGLEGDTWRPPTGGWHVDGIQFHHRLSSPDQGLLPLFFFSDVNPTDGGTAVSVGSHIECARILAEAEPEGLTVFELSKRVLAQPGVLDASRVEELTGRAGDVALLHPFVLHARSPKIGGDVRFICNPCIALKAPMNIEEPSSPVEIAIARALEAQPA